MTDYMTFTKHHVLNKERFTYCLSYNYVGFIYRTHI